MRLIDADALIERYGEPCHSFLDVIKDMPTIDAVRVVHCKDCKHWGIDYYCETENIKVCEYANYLVYKNGYCIFGERNIEQESER